MEARRTYLPRAILVIGMVLLVWPILIAWLAYATGTLEGMVFGACTVFAIVSLGVPAVLARLGRRRPGARRDEREGGSLQGIIETQAGPLRLPQAAFQILVIPGAIAVGFTAIAVIEIVVRHAA